MLTFEYKVLALWNLDAPGFVQRRAICLYTLLPAMRGATASLLKQALREMKQHYPRQQLGHHLIRFRRIMQRSRTMTEHDKQDVEEELHMEFAYDWFLDDNPEVQERVEKGEKRGEIQALQRLAVPIIKQRFPGMTTQAQEHVKHMHTTKELEWLILQLTSAANEAEARQILSLQARHEQG